MTDAEVRALALVDADAAAHDLAARLEGRPAEELVSLAAAAFGGELVLASSFGLEDVALVHMLSLATPSARARIITLDTGRLSEETYPLIARVEERYGVRIETYFPDRLGVEALVRRQGHNGFFASVEARKACCAVRKLEPLGRAFEGARAWMTGLRRDQSVTRSRVGVVEWDGRVKVNPLADWTLARVFAYVREHDIPHSPLHERGYPSIGCAPCTRAIAAGEPERAGRWWWESAEQKECGIHTERAKALRASQR